MTRTLTLPQAVDATAFRLLNDWQRDFPLVPRPFARIGQALGIAEAEVVARYRELAAEGVLSRIGPVFTPRRLGASALAALAAPPARLEEVAARVSREATINHNYEREHRFNLWFVVTAPSAAELDAVVARIEADTGCAVMVLPLEEEFHIDLGFDLAGAGARRPSHRGASAAQGAGRGGVRRCDASALPEAERRLIASLQGGLPLEAAPFAAVAEAAGMDEAAVLAQIAHWLDTGLVRRFGAVVRHHELGLDTNAMCVWDVPDAEVSALGRALAAEPAVTLCYRRRRVPPDWPYNLFCMIHGSSREEVLAARGALVERHRMTTLPHAVLFSLRRFKQQGACYLPPKESAAHV